MHIYFTNGFASGTWLIADIYSNYIKSAIAATAWLLWKSRCDHIFRSICINLPTVVCRALAHVQEFTDCRRSLLGRRLLLNNLSSSDDFVLFSCVIYNPATKVRSVGFFITSSNYVIFIAGYCLISSHGWCVVGWPLRSRRQLDLQAASDHRLGIKHIFVQSPSTSATITNPDPVVSWRFNTQLSNIKRLLIDMITMLLLSIGFLLTGCCRLYTLPPLNTISQPSTFFSSGATSHIGSWIHLNSSVSNCRNAFCWNHLCPVPSISCFVHSFVSLLSFSNK